MHRPRGRQGEHTHVEGSVADTETWKPTKFGPSGQSGPGGSADKHGVISSANQNHGRVFGV